MDRIGTVTSALVLGFIVYVAVTGDWKRWAALLTGSAASAQAAPAAPFVPAPLAQGNTVPSTITPSPDWLVGP